MASTIASLGGTLIMFGGIGLVLFLILYLVNEKRLADHKRWIDHGKMSIEKRTDELKAMEGVGYVARNCHFKLHEQRAVYNAASKSTQKEGAVLHGIYRALVEIDRQRIVGWKTTDFRSFDGFRAKWPLDKIPCHEDFTIPLASATRLEIAPFSESDHRATSDSFYIYMVTEGKTHIFAQDTTMKDVRELRELLQGYINEFKGGARPKAVSSVDDNGIPT